MHRLRNQLAPLRVLDAVHRAAGVARAAERLHITPGAVSHQIRKLEHDLGVQLVLKSGRDIGFTATGEALATSVAEIFDQLEAVLAKATAAATNRRIRVKVIPSFAIKWLMPRLGSLYLQHDDIDIEIATVSRADDTDLSNADFVVRRGDGNWPGLRADLLFPDELVLACSPEVAARIRTPDDLKSEKLLRSMIAPDSWNMWFASQGLTLDASTRFVPLANAVLCLQAATEGVGVALTQRAYLMQELASGALVQPLDYVARSNDGYFLVSDPNRSALAPARTFIEWILSAA